MRHTSAFHWAAHFNRKSCFPHLHNYLNCFRWTSFVKDEYKNVIHAKVLNIVPFSITSQKSNSLKQPLNNSLIHMSKTFSKPWNILCSWRTLHVGQFFSLSNQLQKEIYIHAVKYFIQTLLYLRLFSICSQNVACSVSLKILENSCLLENTLFSSVLGWTVDS